jgi:hypothetical protein
VSAERTADDFVIEACRSCKAPVVWGVTTKNGATMPVDAEPVDDGNIELRPGAHGKGAVATVLTGPSLLGGPLRKSHFATCPDAEEWRRFA